MIQKIESTKRAFINSTTPYVASKGQYFVGIWNIGISRIKSLQIAKEIATDLNYNLADSALWERHVLEWEAA